MYDFLSKLFESSEYKYPEDRTPTGKENLTEDKSIIIPRNRMDKGTLRIFEFKIDNATSLDQNVSFKIYGGLNKDIMDSSNLQEIVDSADVISQTGNLTFQRSIGSSVLHTFIVVISGTDPNSTAQFLIRSRCA